MFILRHVWAIKVWSGNCGKAVENPIFPTTSLEGVAIDARVLAHVHKYSVGLATRVSHHPGGFRSKRYTISFAGRATHWTKRARAAELTHAERENDFKRATRGNEVTKPDHPGKNRIFPDRAVNGVCEINWLRDNIIVNNYEWTCNTIWVCDLTRVRVRTCVHMYDMQCVEFKWDFSCSLNYCLLKL